MTAGYTLDELRSLYNRNRYKRDVWDRLHDFAPGLTQAELEKIVGETKKEQYEGRKKKAVSMRASGAKPEEIAKTIDMSVNTIKNIAAKWEKELGLANPEQERTAMDRSTGRKDAQNDPETDSEQTEEQEKEKREPAVPTPAIPRDCTAFSGENASENGMAQRKAEQVQKEQEEERQILYRKVEELERRNESLKEAVAAAEARYNAAAQGQMAALEEVKRLTAANLTPSPAGMAQREEASAEKEAPTVGGLIREAMKVISEGKLGDGERISVERSELGTTVLIETLA